MEQTPTESETYRLGGFFSQYKESAIGKPVVSACVDNCVHTVNMTFSDVLLQ